MQYLSLLVACLAATALTYPALKRQQDMCQPGDELACCQAENDNTPINGTACTPNILGNNCPNGIFQCCNVNQDGLINVNLACIAVQVPLC